MSKEIKNVLKEAIKHSDGIDTISILGFGENQTLSLIQGCNSRTTVLMLIAELEMMKLKLIEKMNFLNALVESEED